ncbi:MAG TPA: hypothetical protein VKF35_00165, partial [Hyphomicrobiaceae bacterium]|nr:hypothetical protein [Hyphomicrobiaceae bacterium]
ERHSPYPQYYLHKRKQNAASFKSKVLFAIALQNAQCLRGFAGGRWIAILKRGCRRAPTPKE